MRRLVGRLALCLLLLTAVLAAAEVTRAPAWPTDRDPAVLATPALGSALQVTWKQQAALLPTVVMILLLAVAGLAAPRVRRRVASAWPVITPSRGPPAGR